MTKETSYEMYVPVLSAETLHDSMLMPLYEAIHQMEMFGAEVSTQLGSSEVLGSIINHWRGKI